MLVFETPATNYVDPVDGKIPPVTFFEALRDPADGRAYIAGLHSNVGSPTVLVRDAGGEVVEVTWASRADAGNRVLLASEVVASVADLAAIKGKFKYNATYQAANVKAQIDALKSARPASGATVSVIYSGDPGTWDGDGTSGIVRFTDVAGDPHRFEEPHRNVQC